MRSRLCTCMHALQLMAWTGNAPEDPRCTGCPLNVTTEPAWSAMYCSGLTLAFAAATQGIAAGAQESVHDVAHRPHCIPRRHRLGLKDLSIVEALHAGRCTDTCQGHNDVREVHATHEAPAAPAEPATQPVWGAWAQELPNLLCAQLNTCRKAGRCQPALRGLRG